jgi:hypothetical protein
MTQLNVEIFLQKNASATKSSSCGNHPLKIRARSCQVQEAFPRAASRAVYPDSTSVPVFTALMFLIGASPFAAWFGKWI